MGQGAKAVPETYKFDPSHSSLAFSAKHMMIATVRGSFRDFDGQAEVEGNDPSTVKAEVIIKAASLESGAEDRDKHLRGADFFDVEKYPEIRFVNTAIKPLGKDTYAVTGDLTIKDVTHPVELKATVSQPINDPWGNERVGLSLEGEINRKDWGLNWNMVLEAGSVLVGETIKLNLDVVALRPVPVAS
jgi:polyisoprenoid-binding protein YceI